MIRIVKGFSIVNETEVDVFLEFSCSFCDPANVGNLIFGSSVFSKPSLYIWKFSVHVLLKPSLKDSEHNLINMESECNYQFEHSLVLSPWELGWSLTFSSSVSIAGFSKFADILSAAF